MTKILMKGRLKTLYLECSICGCLVMTDEYSLTESHMEVGIITKNCPCCGYGLMNNISKKEAKDILCHNHVFTNIDVND